MQQCYGICLGYCSRLYSHFMAFYGNLKEENDGNHMVKHGCIRSWWQALKIIEMDATPLLVARFALNLIPVARLGMNIPKHCIELQWFNVPCMLRAVVDQWTSPCIHYLSTPKFWPCSCKSRCFTGPLSTRFVVCDLMFPEFRKKWPRTTQHPSLRHANV